jgi:hypothetical protein
MSRARQHGRGLLPDGLAHRVVRRRLRRTCSCGLRWPCQERSLAAINSSMPPQHTTPQWHPEHTAALLQVGRVGWLTRARAWRYGDRHG